MDTIHPLRAYRERQSLSQEGLAALIGVSKVAISRWETGKRKPEESLLPAIMSVTGIPAHSLRPDLADLFRPRRKSV